ncbi:M48 family metallopeptidase [Sulfurisoma sediminicola]|nr:M48 family metallopeptidase [Sulfurisoma sediminicola]
MARRPRWTAHAAGLQAVWRGTLAVAVAATLLFVPPAALAQVDVGKPSSLRNLVPADQLEGSAAQQYGDLKRQAAAKGALAPDNHPQVRRLRDIAAKIIPFAGKWNPRAGHWRWEVNLIGSRQINAFCMPGGKIAFYTGILDTLRLNDDEVAMVMGHEIAHALREHARERIAKSELTNLGASLLGEFIGGGKYTGAFQLGGSLLSLKFSRDDESEADVVGMELAARAGFDPRAGVSLWQKMATASRGAPPQWLSTHPSGNNRIQEIERHLPQVMPLYQQAAKR